MVRHSGIGTHIRGLLEGWRDVAPEFRPTLLGDPAVIRELLPDAARYTIVPFRAPVYGLREQLAFPSRKTRGTVLHCPHYNIALRHNGPLVVTIHDLIHLDARWGTRSPARRLYARWMLRAAVRRAGHIFAVSQATADELAARIGAARDKISVVYNAPSRSFLDLRAADTASEGRAADRSEAIEQFRRETGLPAEYLLTVGLYKPHKNLDMLLETFKLLRERGEIALPLVVAGVQERERTALGRRLARLGVAEHVRVLDRLPGDRLPLLYGGATALIHPSVREGFGLPIVEAQAVGTPVVASRASAIPEVAGKGALFFDPYDGADLARQVVAVVKDAAVRERLIAEGRRNVERFSWRESAQKVLSVYEQVARLQKDEG